jgi:HEAT repeat protein
MTKWYESKCWLLTSLIAAQFAGCAQTSQWVSKVTGKSEEVAEVDGREHSQKKDKEKVKVASEKDAREKAAKQAKQSKPTDEHVAVKPKSRNPFSGLFTRKPKSDEQSSPIAEDAFEDEIEEPAHRKTRSYDENQIASRDELPARKSNSQRGDDRVAVANRRSRAAAENQEDVREASHSDRRTADSASIAQSRNSAADQRRYEPVDEEVTTSFVEESVSKKLSRLKPSQVSYLQLCPQAQGEVRALIQGLEDENLEQVKRNVHRLGRLGAEAAAALPALAQLEKHPDGQIRVHAALAICRIDTVTPSALDILMQELKSSDPGLRSFAAAVIAELGPQSGEAMPALVEALNDSDPYVRLHVAEVLIRYDEYSEQALETLLHGLSNSDENIRWLTTYSLAELAPQSEHAVTALSQLLDDSSMKVRIGAVYALGEIGGLSLSAARQLRRYEHDSNLELSSAVAYALEQIETAVKQRN